MTKKQRNVKRKRKQITKEQRERYKAKKAKK